MKRTVIFASYDKNGIIHDYVLNYLKYLKEIANNIIFIADNEALPDEQAKLKDLCSHSEFSRHGEYDFGSYKRGFQYALKSGLLDKTDELVFCNDSCFCAASFVPIFEKMADVKCDFWGMTDSKEPYFHLQSYFLVFKKKVFASNSFEKWIDEIKRQDSSDKVVDIYELGLTSFLERNGFKSASFIKSSTNVNPTSQTSLLLKQGSPLVKKKIFSSLNSISESRQLLLRFLKRNYKESYNFICTYYYNQGCYLFPLWLPVYSKKIKRFVYQKKVTHRNKTIIKIFKIPLPVSRLKKIFNNIFSINKVALNKTKCNVLFIKFSIHHKPSAKDRLELLEKQIISNSKFWNASWYIKKYGYQFNLVEALDYWYKIGWKKGESPSQYINVKYCGKACGGINPIIAYLDNSLIFSPDNRNNYKSNDDNIRISDYLRNKNKRQAKSVVYTCITNDYDDIHELEAYGYINQDWDYVCFTDNEADIKKKYIGIWEIRPLVYSQSDVSRNNCWHKLHPHILFPEYEESIYIDANINILSDFLFKQIEGKGATFTLPRHFKNICVYQEIADVTKAKMDTKERINQAEEFLKNNHMPQNYGFCENNVLYRRHNNPKIIDIMEEWWNLLEKYAKRDQLYLTYLLYKNGFKIEDITFENTRLLHDDFYVFGHRKKGKKE